jgi:MFS family permease
LIYRRVALLLFAAGWGANHFAALLLVYKQELSLSAAELGILFAVYAVGLVPGLLIAGRLSDARGRRALVLRAAVAAMAASVLLAFGSHGFAVLFAGRLVYGLAMGCIVSPGSVWVQELSSPELGPRRATLALSAGFGIGPLASGLLAELVPAPTVTPYVATVLLLAVALVGVLPVPETAKSAAAVTGVPAPRISLGRTELSLLAQLLPVAPWSFGLMSVTSVTMAGLFRPYVSHPILYAGLLALVTLMTGVLVQPLTTRVGRRADLLGMAVGLVGLGVAAVAVTRHAPLLAFAAAPLLGCAYGLIMTTGLREVAQRTSPRERGTVVGMYYVLTYVGFAMPVAFANLAGRFGDIRTLGGIAVAVSVCFLVRAAIEARVSPAPAA